MKTVTTGFPKVTDFMKLVFNEDDPEEFPITQENGYNYAQTTQNDVMYPTEHKD